MKIIKSRREALKTIRNFSCYAAGSVMLSSLFSCKKSDASAKHEVIDQKIEVVTECQKQSMTEQEQSIRKSLNYVDESPLPHRNCLNCKLYTLPAQKNDCGGCKIVPGPIHPQGYCTAWIARM